MILPDSSRGDILRYDLQFIQIPLRTVLTDSVIRIADTDDEGEPIDYFEIGRRNIDQLLPSAMRYNEEHGLLTLVNNFIVPQRNLARALDEINSDTDICTVIRSLNSYLVKKVRTYSNAFIADIDMVANSIGKSYFLDDIIYFSTHGAVINPHWTNIEKSPPWAPLGKGRMENFPEIYESYDLKPIEFYDCVYRQIESIYRSVQQIDMVKMVIFDLDNTLWRGQLVEHYQSGNPIPDADGWPQGLWEAIQHLRSRGIVVSISSKNDENLVIKMWNEAVRPGFVKFTDFLLHRINWKPKADNIIEIINSVSLTAKSVVFVDDNPIERESVLAAIPGIRVMGRDPFQIRRVLLWAPETQSAHISKESRNREKMLSCQIERESQKGAMNREDFLMSLNSRVNLFEIKRIDDPNYLRVFELTNKTNQFNTTGKRWSSNEFSDFMSYGRSIFAFSVSDKYVDYGIVGVVFFDGNFLYQFVMSCRVLGMDIELAVLKHLVSVRLASPGIDTVTASLIETASNTPCRDMFIRSGFTPISSSLFAAQSSCSLHGAAHVLIEFQSNN